MKEVYCIMGYVLIDIIDLPYDVKRVIKHFKNKEYYQAVQQREHYVSYSDTLENFISDERANVEWIVERDAELAALRKALDKLSYEEHKMINDTFFYCGEKPTFLTLAQNSGVTRQAYISKLNRLLAKLREVIEYYLIHEDEI